MFFKEMMELENIEFPRCVKPSRAVGEPVLMVFSDASENAYGAYAYARWRLENCSFARRLIASKNHLSPKKKITIVRLELNGAVIAKRLKVTIEKEFRMKFINVISLSIQR